MFTNMFNTITFCTFLSLVRSLLFSGCHQLLCINNDFHFFCTSIMPLVFFDLFCILSKSQPFIAYEKGMGFTNCTVTYSCSMIYCSFIGNHITFLNFYIEITSDYLILKKGCFHILKLLISF